VNTWPAEILADLNFPSSSSLIAVSVHTLTMATQTATMTANERMAQVRIQLSTRSPDIELPEETGPILVSTGKKDA